MKTAGIICEYNVFHNGHKRQIDYLRSLGYNCIICVMSGNYTQRGEMAIADKYTRAECAIAGGADLVFELPFPFSSLSAEGFAISGVHILSSIGIGAICFGSESDDKKLLQCAAEAINSDEFIKAYSGNRSTGSAQAFFEVLREIMGEDASFLSNDILAISYIAAAKKLNAELDLIHIKREGAGYRDNALGNINPSATAIRAAIKKGENGFLSVDDKYLPKKVLDILRYSQSRGLCPVLSINASREILSFFKLMSPQDISHRAISLSRGGSSVAEDGDGLVERICKAAKGSNSIEELLSCAYNARHTDARVNRVLLFSLLGVSDSLARSLPQYTTLLAANNKGREYLTSIRKNNSFTIVTKPADTPDCAQKDILALADSFYTLAMPSKTEYDYFIKKKPYIANTDGI